MLDDFESEAFRREFEWYIVNTVFSWKETFQSVFMALPPPRSSPPGLCNVNNLASNLFPTRSDHVPELCGYLTLPRYHTERYLKV